MRVWYFSEMAYHPAWEEGLKRGSLRVVLPNAQLRPAGRPRTAQPLSRRVRAVRRGRARHHGQRAPQHLDLPDHLGADGTGDHRPRDQARAPAVARQRRSPTGPIRCASPRRWPGSTCCRAGARDGPRQGRALRDRAGQQQPGQPHAPLLGSARPDPQGDVDDRRPVQLGRRVLPLPQRQHLAAAAAAADAAGLDDRPQRRHRPDGGRDAATWSAPCCPAVGAEPMFDAYRKRAQELGWTARARPLRLCRRASASARRARRACGAPI